MVDIDRVFEGDFFFRESGSPGVRRSGGPEVRRSGGPEVLRDLYLLKWGSSFLRLQKGGAI